MPKFTYSVFLFQIQEVIASAQRDDAGSTANIWHYKSLDTPYN